MPELNWIGKQAVRAHHREVDFHLLKDVPELACVPDLETARGGDAETGNLIVQGDNLLALKALLPRYAGQVKCIYIDPPYNTGNEGWVYNDNVKAPEIQKWLHQVVGKEAEDLSRHDKWLCMMYPRLQLLKRFLREDGAIFVSIDDNEVASLRLLMNEIFGANNFVTTLTWIKRVSPANDARFVSTDTEFILIYAKRLSEWTLNRLARTTEQLGNYQNPDNDSRGPWNSTTYTCNKSADERPNLYFPLTQPNTGEQVWPTRTAVWKFNQEAYQIHATENRIWWGKDGKSKKPRLKSFLSDMGNVVPRSFWKYEECGHTQEARTELLDIISDCPFSTPKPTRLIQRILQIATDKDSLVLDSFAGSGTTGHAVLKQNAEDGGTRRYILVEMEEKIARTITAERVRRVVERSAGTPARFDAIEEDDAVLSEIEPEGEGDLFSASAVKKKRARVPALPSEAVKAEMPESKPMPGFRFAVLGDTLFDAEGNIRETVTFAELAEFVWFQQTGAPLPPVSKKAKRTALLGIHRGVAVYLLFNGILGDKTVNGGNVLTRPLLAQLPAFDGEKVIYGAACRMSELHLRQAGVSFKQLPYHLEVNAWL